MTRPVVFLIALALVGCTSRPPLADPKGPWRAMNPGRWEPTADDLRGVRVPLLPGQSPAVNSAEGRS